MLLNSRRCCGLVNSWSIAHLTAALLAVCSIIAITEPRATAAGADDLVARLPDSTRLVLVSDDLKATCEAMQKTDLGRQFCGAAFAPLVAELRKTDRGGPMHLRPWLGLDWPELSAHSGPAALAVIQQADGFAGTVCLFGGPGDSAEAAALRKQATDYFTAKRWRATASTKGTTKFVTYDGPAPAGKGRAPRRVWFENDAVYGIASTLPSAEVAAAGGGKSLMTKAGAKAHLSANAERAASAEARYYVEPLPLWETMRKTRGMKPEGRDYLLTAQRLGMSGISEVGGRMTFNAKNADFQVTADIVTPRPYQKALRVLEMPVGPMPALPVWVDDRAERVTSWRWDFSQAIGAMGNVFDEINDPGADGVGLFDQMIDSLAADPEGPKIDLRKDLFPLLGPHFTEVSYPRAPVAGKHQESDTLTEVECVKDVAVAAVLRRYFAGDKSVTHDTIGDYEYWTVGDDGALFATGENNSSLTIRGAAVGKGRAIFSTRGAALVSTIKLLPKGAASPITPTAPWKAFDDWRKSAEQKTTALRSWTKGDALGEAYEAACKPRPVVAKPPAKAGAKAKPKKLINDDDEQLATRLWMCFLYGTAQRSSDLPYDAAPAFAKWKGALSPVGMVMTRTEAGWSINLSTLHTAP